VIPYTLVYDGASVGPWEIYLENIYGVFWIGFWGGQIILERTRVSSIKYLSKT
jgi:hypothetical protein